jgi:hypothetical protein
MLHWSQEASTGWTRNSWGGSMAKRVVPFRFGAGSGAGGGSVVTDGPNLPSALDALQKREAGTAPRAS